MKVKENTLANKISPQCKSTVCVCVRICVHVHACVCAHIYTHMRGGRGGGQLGRERERKGGVGGPDPCGIRYLPQRLFTLCLEAGSSH